MRTQMFQAVRGDRFDVPNYAILITDGNSNINQQNTIKEAVKARVDGIHFITVSVGKMLNMIELKGMASDMVDDNMFQVESFDDLSSLVSQMPLSICNSKYNNYVINYIYILGDDIYGCVWWYEMLACVFLYLIRCERVQQQSLPKWWLMRRFH